MNRTPNPKICESFGRPGLVPVCQDCPGRVRCYVKFNESGGPFALRLSQRTFDIKAIEEVERIPLPANAPGGALVEELWFFLYKHLTRMRLFAFRSNTGDVDYARWDRRVGYGQRVAVQTIVIIKRLDDRQVAVELPSVHWSYGDEAGLIVPRSGGKWRTPQFVADVTRVPGDPTRPLKNLKILVRIIEQCLRNVTKWRQPRPRTERQSSS